MALSRPQLMEFSRRGISAVYRNARLSASPFNSAVVTDEWMSSTSRPERSPQICPVEQGHSLPTNQLSLWHLGRRPAWSTQRDPRLKTKRRGPGWELQASDRPGKGTVRAAAGVRPRQQRRARPVEQMGGRPRASLEAGRSEAQARGRGSAWAAALSAPPSRAPAQARPGRRFPPSLSSHRAAAAPSRARGRGGAEHRAHRSASSAAARPPAGLIARSGLDSAGGGRGG